MIHIEQHYIISVISADLTKMPQMQSHSTLNDGVMSHFHRIYHALNCENPLFQCAAPQIWANFIYKNIWTSALNLYVCPISYLKDAACDAKHAYHSILLQVVMLHLL